MEGVGCSPMEERNPSQTKAAIWADKGGKNAATPVFDPGLSPMGTDAEAGGAPFSHTAGEPVANAPTVTTPESGGIGLRLTPKVWGLGALVLLVILAVVAIASF